MKSITIHNFIGDASTSGSPKVQLDLDIQKSAIRGKKKGWIYDLGL